MIAYRVFREGDDFAKISKDIPDAIDCVVDLLEVKLPDMEVDGSRLHISIEGVEMTPEQYEALPLLRHDD